MKRRERLFRWMCPEVESMLEQAKGIVREYEKAKDSLRIDGKEVSAKEGIVFLGDVTDTSITVTPELHTEVILSKFELKSLLHLDGERQTVRGSIFNGQSSKITGMLTASGEKGVDSAKGIRSMKHKERKRR